MTSKEDLIYQAKFYARKLDKDGLETLMYDIEKIYFDLLDSAGGLTTDAPEMTVGDSGSVSEKAACPFCDAGFVEVRLGEYEECGHCNKPDKPSTNDCPFCRAKGITHMIGDKHDYTCEYCAGTGQLQTNEPENRTPSPTPSFR